MQTVIMMADWGNSDSACREIAGDKRWHKEIPFWGMKFFEVITALDILFSARARAELFLSCESRGEQILKHAREQR